MTSLRGETAPVAMVFPTFRPSSGLHFWVETPSNAANVVGIIERELIAVVNIVRVFDPADARTSRQQHEIGAAVRLDRSAVATEKHAPVNRGERIERAGNVRNDCFHTLRRRGTAVNRRAKRPRPRR